MHDVLTHTAIRDIPASKVSDQPIKPNVVGKLFLSGIDDMGIDVDSSDGEEPDEENKEVVACGKGSVSSTGKATLSSSVVGQKNEMRGKSSPNP